MENPDSRPTQTDHRPTAFRLGLIGWPLGHSLSPQLHAAALHAAGLQGTYQLYPIPPGPASQEQLAALLAEMRRGDLHGLNVTIPHKQAILPWLAELTPIARATGAVNTIYMQSGRLCGDNTDPPGFWADLNQALVAAGEDAPGFAGSTALVLGAGGSARAVVYALLTTGWQVCLAARRLEQAEQLTLDMRSAIHNHQSSIFPFSLTAASLQKILPACRLLVNCTPVGMFPHEAASPWPAGLGLPPQAFVYDLVYNPPETVLVRAARRARLDAVTGLGMLIEQAALSFERWTGVKASRKAMWTAVSQLDPPRQPDHEPVLKD